MQITWSKTRKKFPLSHKKIAKKTISNIIAIFIAIFLLFMYAFIFLTTILSNNEQAFTYLGIATIIFFGLIFLIIILNYFYQCWYFANYFYDLTEDYIVIRKNPITPREITIPYERIQDVNIDQDILDRIFGLYDVHLSSATVSSGIMAHIDGVEKQAADGLRNELLDIVHKRISKNKK